MPDEGRSRLQISLARFFLLSNVYTAVACLCILPAFQLWELGVGDGISLVALELVTVPLAWVLTSFVMIRDRHVRAATITAFLLSSVSAVLGIVVWTSLPLVMRVWQRGLRSLGQIDVPVLFIAVIVLSLLTLAFIALAHRLRNILRPLRPDP